MRTTLSHAVLLALGCAAALTTQAATIINIAATSPFGVTLALGAGSYEFSFIGKADGGQFDAWSAWGPKTDCGEGGCPTGFINELRVEGINTDPMFIGDHFNPIWATAGEAVAAAKANHSPFTLTLAVPATVRFLVGEGTYCATGVANDCWADNSGGLSLMAGAVPEPETYALMLAGLAAVGLAGRRRRP